MNQILATSNEKQKNKEPINIQKIIIIFSIIIIVFGLLIIVIHFAKTNKPKPKPSPLPQEPEVKPEISIEQLDIQNIKIIAKYDKGIDIISYTWNDEDTYNFNNLGGEKNVEKLIEMPPNITNNIKVTVIGSDGTTAELTKKLEQQGDITNPEIDLKVSNKLQIIATDDTEIAYIKYKWNNEDEVIINADSNSKTKIDTTIEIKRGKNELTITAVDVAGNIATQTKTFKGIKEPEIMWVRYGDIIRITVSHDKGFKKIVFKINEKEHLYDSNSKDYDSTKTEVVYEVKIDKGNNLVIVEAYSNEESERIRRGQATYNP